MSSKIFKKLQARLASIPQSTTLKGRSTELRSSELKGVLLPWLGKETKVLVQLV